MKEREKIPVKLPPPEERAPHRPTHVHDEGHTKKPEISEENAIDEGLRELEEDPDE